MKSLLMNATSGNRTPRQLERSIRQSTDRPMKFRRGIVAISLVGIAAMGVVSLLQTGLVRHLPDPPTKKPDFDSDKVNTSRQAYSYGMPDAPLTIAAHAVTLAIAAAGPADRYRSRPWLPLLAALVALPQAAVAGRYLFHQMPKVDKAWCPWCVVDALTHFATVALTVPEALKAGRSLMPKGAI